jgi:hypothetical protein
MLTPDADALPNPDPDPDPDPSSFHRLLMSIFLMHGTVVQQALQ